MPRKNTPKSKLFQQYEREYKRIQQAIRRQTKLGYFVPDELKPVQPSKIGKVTSKDVKRLTKLTPQAIRKKSIYVDQTTGESFEGLDIVKKRRKAIQHTKKDKKTKPRKPKPTEQEYAPPKENSLNVQIIDDITELLDRWQPTSCWKPSWVERKTTYVVTLRDLWEATLMKEGTYEVAYRLENNADYYYRLIDRVIHGSDSVMEDEMNLSEIIRFLINRPLTAEESDMYTTQAMDYIRDTLIGDSFG